MWRMKNTRKPAASSRPTSIAAAAMQRWWRPRMSQCRR